MAKKTPWWERYLVPLALVVAFGLLLAHYGLSYWTTKEGIDALKIVDEIFFLEVPRAVIIAILVGLAIDWNFSRKLAKDVFEAAVGHIMPPELRPELTWIAGYNLVCVRSDHTYTFKEGTSSEKVIMEAEWYRIFKNVGSSKCLLELKLGIERETTQDFPSRISQIGYREEGKEEGGREWTFLSEKELERVSENQGWTITHKVKHIDLAPGEQVETRWQFEMQKEINGDEYISFSYPTANLTVTVNPHPNLEVDVSSGHRKKLEERTSTTRGLNETLLPGQYIRVRWRKKEAG